MEANREIHYVSENAELAVSLSPGIASDLEALASIGKGQETGGILIGYYSPGRDRAIVTEVSGAPSDSKSTRASFIRGIRGLQKLINAAWKRHRYYLGEWHLHPNSSPRPSSTDIGQMQDFAADPKRNCSQPVLIVVGSDAAGSFDMTVTLVSATAIVELTRQMSWALPAPAA
jgi:integrative and conjugative element protein (TIGR02256 family)